MQTKDKKNLSLLILPEDIVKTDIGDQLEISNIGRLTRTCRKLHGIFNDRLKDTKILLPLLKCIAYSELEQAENIIIKNPKLLVIKGEITDYSDRTFKNITPFELALWYKDRRMIRMIRKYLSRDEAAKQLHEYLFLETTYKKTYGKSYNLSELINALKACINIKNNLNAKIDLTNNCENYVKSFIQLAKVQKSVPVHIAIEYCNPNHLLNSKQFDEEKLEYFLELCDDDNGTFINWFPLIQN